MATAMMLKAKPSSKLPLHFLRYPISALTRPVAPIPQPEVANETPQLSLNKASTFPLLGMTRNLFTGESGFGGVRDGGFALAGGAVFVRQMGTMRPPRGSSSRIEDEDEDDDVEEMDDFDDEGIEDLDDDEGVDDFDEDEVADEDDEEEEEEKPKRKKRC